MTVRVRRLTVEHHREPFGIGEPRPRLSWQIETDEQGWQQAAYEIEVAGPDGTPSATGMVRSAESHLVAWPAPEITSRDRRSVRVRVWGPADPEPSAWGDPVEIETGLLAQTDWSAQLVGPDRDLGERLDRPPVLVRKAFEVGGAIEQARLYVSAHGMYAAEINGRRVLARTSSPRAGPATTTASAIRPTT